MNTIRIHRSTNGAAAQPEQVLERGARDNGVGYTRVVLYSLGSLSQPSGAGGEGQDPKSGTKTNYTRWNYTREQREQ